MVIWALANKEMRLLLRDRMAVVVLLGMPLVFILLWGVMLGENFGQRTADEKLRVFVVDLDTGESFTPGVSWAKEVVNDLNQTAGVGVEVVPSLEEAEQRVRKHKVAAILIFRPGFSDRVNQCSFLAEGINPFYHDGVHLPKYGSDEFEQARRPGPEAVLDAELLWDRKQPAAAGIIDQVAQVSLLRVILPWMIGQAFGRLSDEQFIELLGEKMSLPLPNIYAVRVFFDPDHPLKPADKVQLKQMLDLTAGSNEKESKEYRKKVGEGVQAALEAEFHKYDLTGKTWADLTKSREAKPGDKGGAPSPENTQWTNFGAQRYQQLVPSFTTMFPFFLAMVVGWVFVTERRQGTLKRLRFAPVSRAQILAGKLLPVFLLSLALAGVLLLAGRLIFQMTWGPQDWPLWLQIGCLLPVVVTTSFASMGLALLVAAVSRTEIQVALYGALPVLVMALVSGCILPREMMTESAQAVSWFTPHGWALAAYRELLGDDPRSVPDLSQVWMSCGVLTAFGAGFLGLAWRLLRLD
ncbi:MAG TPA: ABC transporter permease [Gemmataceae bacterium]|nr:ABC transporter permease [Gemmataceae bacterium]